MKPAVLIKFKINCYIHVLIFDKYCWTLTVPGDSLFTCLLVILVAILIKSSRYSAARISGHSDTDCVVCHCMGCIGDT